MRPEAVPDHHGDVLGRRIEGLEIGNVKVEVFMVKGVFDMRTDKVGKLFDIDYKARFRIDFPRYRNDQFVIVPVEIRIVALAKHRIVAFVRPIGPVEPMGSVEMGATGNSYFHGGVQLKGVFFQEVVEFVKNDTEPDGITFRMYSHIGAD